MADVSGKFFSAKKVRTGVSPSSPGVEQGETLPPVNPPGTSLNSVGLTMPSAFEVANSPLTSNGTIAVTGAGTVAQYVRGDGSLADFPSATGGGSSVSYYLNGSVNQGTIGGIAYRELSKTPILGAGTDFTISADGYIASFITDAGDPNLLEIPGGNWNFETYFQASSGGGSPTFYVELYKVNSGGTATLIATSSGSPELIAFGTNINPYFSTLAVPTTTLALTDRLAIRYYVTHAGRTITMHTENNTLCQIITTFTTGLTALNGLTAQVQFFAVGTSGTNFNIASATDTHTFNLPTASATNRGALASADWSTFNNKQNQLNGTGFVKANGTTISYDNSTYQVTSEKGQPNGYASLDGNGKVPLAQINDALIGNVNYQGLWNASTNNPTLVNPPSSGTKGYYYIVSTAGTFAGISFEVGDWIISNGSAWQKVDNTDAVSSVFGRTGNVIAANGDYNTSQVTENTNLYFTQARVSANTDVAANTAARHNAVTLGTANGLSLSTQQLSLQLATSGQNGALSSTDWTTFNNKENAITAGTTAQYFRGDKTFQTLNTSVVPELTNLYYTEARVNANANVAANTAARHAAVTLGTANGLSLSTQQLSLGLASAGVTGALSGTDWSTFNSKQQALNGTGFVKISGTTISYDNSTYLTTAAAASTYLPLAGGTMTGNINWTANDVGLTWSRNTDGAAIKFISVGDGTGESYLQIGTSDNGNEAIVFTQTSLIRVQIDTDGLLKNGSSQRYVFENGGTWGIAVTNGVVTTGSYANPSWITSLDWSKIISRPTTLAGYGITDAVPSNRTITINGTAQDLSANRTFNVGTVTSVAALTLGTSGTDLSSSVANGTTTPVITLNVPTASAANRGALSAADWTTFNNKQNALTNPVTGTGTTNYLPKFTGTSTIGNSAIFENAGNVAIGINSSTTTLRLYSLTEANLTFTSDGAGGDQAAIYVQKGAGNGLVFAEENRDFIWRTGAAALTAGGGTQVMRLTNGGNLGLGVTPSAWGLGKAIEIGNIGNSVWGVNATQFNVLQNVYYDGGGFKYASTNAASYYQQASGAHAWYTASSGTAGAAISWTQAMTLGSNSGLSIGTPSAAPAQGLLVIGDSGIGTVTPDVFGRFYTRTLGLSSIGSTAIQINGGSGGYGQIDFGAAGVRTAGISASANETQWGSVTGIPAIIYTNGATRLTIHGTTGAATFSSSVTAGGDITSTALEGKVRITSTAGAGKTYQFISIDTGNLGLFDGTAYRLWVAGSGNVGIGTVSPNYLLHIAAGAANPQMQFTSTGTGSTTSDGFHIGVNNSTLNAFLLQKENADLQILTNDTERLRITSGGALLVGTTNTYSNTATQGDIVLQDKLIFGADQTGNANNRNWSIETNSSQSGSFDIVSSSANNSWPNAAYRLTLTRDGKLLVNTVTDNGNYFIQANGNIASINASAAGLFTVSGTRSIGIQSFAGDWNYLRSNGQNLVFGTQDANTLYIRTSDVDRLTIASTGAATFSSSVSVNSSASNIVSLTVSGNTGDGVRQRFLNQSGSGLFNFQIGTHISAANAFEIGTSSTTDGTSFNNIFRILNTGAATFSSSVTAGDAVTITSNISTSYALNLLGRNTTGNASTINFFNNAGSTRYGFIYADSSSYEIGSISGSNIPLTFSTNQTERMRIASNGNVGIGTNSPQSNLQVLGTIKVATGNAQGILGLGEANGTTVNVGLWRGAANAPTTDGNFLNLGGFEGIVFASSNAAIGSQTERMRITSGGNVLIGTTTDGANSRLTVNSNGDGNSVALVGRSLDNKSSLDFVSSNFSTFMATIDVDFSSFDFGSQIDIPLRFYTNTAERMRIFSGGNVRIGASSVTDSGDVLRVGGTTFTDSIVTMRPSSTTVKSDVWKLGRAALATSAEPEDIWVRVQIGTKNYDLLAIDRGTA